MPLKGMRLVLVEDHHDLSEVLEIVLGDVKIETATYDNVDSAINHPDWDITDVALIDWMLPDKDGLHLVSWLKENHPKVRRIVYTASPEQLKRLHPALDAEIVSKGADEKGEFPYSLLSMLRKRRRFHD